ALHGDEPTTEAANHVVTYVPVLQEALRDLALWVEKGVAPPASTRYTIADGQVLVPATAAERHGIQPVVDLKVGGRDSITIRAGQTVRFEGTITVPGGAGYVTRADWDFSGKGAFTTPSQVPPRTREAKVAISHRFDQPGTVYVALKGSAQREGDAANTYRQVQNLGRVRVVVRD
ncbi:MAG TPA: hypothetical protein VMQ93_19345, partial [Novosphingobium sp.]|nr:hypothetical protein [Novosphingobium sp.]